MGCDYYIVKVLRVYCSDCIHDYFDIELEREKGYYYYDFDADEPDYEEKRMAYKQERLTPLSKPIDIYTDRQFRTAALETKYKTLIMQEIESVGKGWDDVVRIMKVEERLERE